MRPHEVAAASLTVAGCERTPEYENVLGKVASNLASYASSPFVFWTVICTAKSFLW